MSHATPLLLAALADDHPHAGALKAAYAVAAVLFILSLGGLSKQETAQRGVVCGIAGMAIALVATFVHPAVGSWTLLAPVLIVGATIGTVMARRVVMTAMPQLVAMLHSFVGLAAVLVGFSTYLDHGAGAGGVEAAEGVVFHLVEVWLGVAIGAITFTGSVVAWGKLRGTITGRPVLLPGRHVLNAAAALAVLAGAAPFVLASSPDAGAATTTGVILLAAMALIALALGVHLVLSIGGADMPVVVSLLNSYSGWAAAAAGFMLGNDLLIITGALVGSSGFILSIIMCRAMNRSIASVVFGGFGTADAKSPAAHAHALPVRETTPDALAAELARARDVVIVPGYGMAVARAQHRVKDLVDRLKERDVRVRFAIHPVAGRLPGHMNVLLAEAGVPYDIVHEMDEINGELPNVDAALVIGANDIVNPSAVDDPDSPIFGMPVLRVWDAKRAVVFKRGMAAGYAGVDNPLFFHEHAEMLFGDAAASADALVRAVEAINPENTQPAPTKPTPEPAAV